MNQENNKVEDTELLISQTLRLGVALSAIITGIGLLMLLVTGNSGYPEGYFPTSLLQIFSGCISLKPYAVILTGLFILILTPVLRVGISILTFIREKDYMYAKITLLVFLILIVSFFMGAAEGG